jgi:hypothetical protein
MRMVTDSTSDINKNEEFWLQNKDPTAHSKSMWVRCSSVWFGLVYVRVEMACQC